MVLSEFPELAPFVSFFSLNFAYPFFHSLIPLSLVLWSSALVGLIFDLIVCMPLERCCGRERPCQYFFSLNKLQLPCASSLVTCHLAFDIFKIMFWTWGKSAAKRYLWCFCGSCAVVSLLSLSGASINWSEVLCWSQNEAFWCIVVYVATFFCSLHIGFLFMFARSAFGRIMNHLGRYCFVAMHAALHW